MPEADQCVESASLTGLFIVAAAPAGWYEVSPNTRRWFDGRSWTDYYAPVLRVVPESLPSTEPIIAARSHSPARGTTERSIDLTSPGFHLIMTVMTLAAWAPVWLAVVAVASVRTGARRQIASGQRALSMRSTRRAKSLSDTSIPVSVKR